MGGGGTAAVRDPGAPVPGFAYGSPSRRSRGRHRLARRAGALTALTALTAAQSALTSSDASTA